MRIPSHVLLVIVSLCAPVTAQSVLFDFDNAPQYASLPLNLTVGGITAQLSATGQGFSIQQANVLGFIPAGFSGLCLYPNSVFAADLLVDFAPTALNDFSIMYAPEEYGCDSSATMRVTAYMNGAYVGTNTTTADPPGTWPTGTLSFSAAQGFDSVVVHYDAPPACGDWGPIFMADNMYVTPQVVLRHGDLNCDGSVNFGDINPFVQYLSNYAAWQAAYPGCNSANGDMNQDGTYPSFGDINPFVSCLTTGQCP